MVMLTAKEITLEQVDRLLPLREQLEPLSFSSLLTLEPLSDRERQEIIQIRNDYRAYLRPGKVLEGQIQFLVLAPLLRLAGFYQPPIYLSLEQGIAPIEILDKDTKITGRMDLLASRRDQSTQIWILVVETKNSEASPRAGLPQLLTYASQSLTQQPSVWGLATNGEQFRFVYLQAGDPPTYQLLPELNLMDDDRALQLLQILKAVRTV
jgi:hypothetical protein